MIVYLDSAAGLSAAQLGGFSVGWPNPPRPQTHLELLRQSAHIWLALDDQTHQPAQGMLVRNYQRQSGPA